MRRSLAARASAAEATAKHDHARIAAHVRSAAPRIVRAALVPRSVPLKSSTTAIVCSAASERVDVPAKGGLGADPRDQVLPALVPWGAAYAE
jgi:hypothetical protein